MALKNTNRQSYDFQYTSIYLCWVKCSSTGCPMHTFGPNKGVLAIIFVLPFCTSKAWNFKLQLWILNAIYRIVRCTNSLHICTEPSVAESLLWTTIKNVAIKCWLRGWHWLVLNWLPLLSKLTTKFAIDIFGRALATLTWHFLTCLQKLKTL